MVTHDDGFTGKQVRIIRIVCVIAVVGALLMLARPARAQGREYLTGPQTFFVDPSSPIQEFVNWAMRLVDSAGYPVTLQLLPGTYGPIRVTGELVGGGSLTLRGTPGETIIDGGSENAIAVVRGTLTVEGVILKTSAAGAGAALMAVDRATIYGGKWIQFQQTGGEHLKASGQSKIVMTEPYHVTGGGVSHVHAFGQSSITILKKVGMDAGPAFSAYVAGASQSEILWLGGFTGNAAAPIAALIHHSSLLYTAGAPIPGLAQIYIVPPDSVKE